MIECKSTIEGKRHRRKVARKQGSEIHPELEGENLDRLHNVAIPSIPVVQIRMVMDGIPEIQVITTIGPDEVSPRLPDEYPDLGY